MVVNNRLEQNKIILELTNDALIVVEVGVKGNNPELVRYALLPIPPEGPPTSTWLQSVWSQKKFSHNRVISLIPSYQVRYRTMTLPNLASEELTAAIQLELESSGNVDYNWQITGAVPGKDSCTVKVALVKKTDLSECYNLLSQAGLELQWSGLRSGGIINFINYNNSFFDAAVRPAAYLDFNRNSTEFGIVVGDELTYCRNFTAGREDLLSEQGETVIEELGRELRLSLASARRGGSDNVPSHVWFFGKPENIDAQVGAMLGTLDLTLQIPNKSGLDGVMTEQLTPEIAPLIGTALGAAGCMRRENWRFLSLQQQARQGLMKRVALGFQAALLLLFLIIGSVFFIQSGLAKKEKIQKWLNGKAEVLNELRKTEYMTRQKLTEIRTLESWLDSRGRELEFLAALQSKLPPGTVISDITIDDGAVKDLSGVTSSVSLLLTAINRDQILGDLKLKGIVSVTGAGELFHLEGPLAGKELKR